MKCKKLKYREICPLCGEPFDSRYGKRSPDGKVVCPECYNLRFDTDVDRSDKQDITGTSVFRIKRTVI